MLGMSVGAVPDSGGARLTMKDIEYGYGTLEVVMLTFGNQ